MDTSHSHSWLPRITPDFGTTQASESTNTLSQSGIISKVRGAFIEPLYVAANKGYGIKIGSGRQWA
jgi:NAD dependent epimerase/dehydratase family enzyme